MNRRPLLALLALLIAPVSCARKDPLTAEGPAKPTPEQEAQAPAEDQARRDEKAQKQTVADIRTVGTAMFSWLTDQVGAAAAGQSERNVELVRYPPISQAELEKILCPQYLPKIPAADGWGYPYEYHLNVANPRAQHVMLIRSPGRDGRYSTTTSYGFGSFAPSDFDADIAWADGFFVQWPQKDR